MNFSDFKEILPNDANIQLYINQKYWNKYIIKYSNVWFIVVSNSLWYVIKYYIPDLYISHKFWEYNEYNLFDKERENYELFKNKNILVPEYIWYWEEKIWNYYFKYAILENIRIKNKRIIHFKELDMNDFVKFILKIHNIKPWYVHWNIHVNDFFITKAWDIWIFNLSSYYKWDIEEDLSKICYWYNLEISYIKKFLLLYWIKKIKFNKLLYNLYALTKLYKYDKINFLKLVNLIKKLKN